MICPTYFQLHSKSVYTLKSVVNHQGNHPQAGHYTAEIYEKDNNMFDDDVISTYDELNTYRSKLSYILAVILQMSMMLQIKF